MTGMGPTGTTRVRLIYHLSSTSSCDAKASQNAHQIERPVIADFDVVELSRQFECVVLPVQVLEPSEEDWVNQ